MIHVKTPTLKKTHNINKNTNNLAKFQKKLQLIENLFKYQNKYKNTNTDHKCTICNIKIHLINYRIPKYKWDSGLYHMCYYHNYTPNTSFIEAIINYNIQINTKIKKLICFNKTTYIISELKYVKLSKNKLMILDALMEHGGYKKKYHLAENNKTKFIHSEHFGLLDFDDTNTLDKIIISARTDRIDPYDNTIYLPNNIPETFKYEYMFHTHPPTPRPGGRANIGIIYELPSISDILHFITFFNKGKTHGSIIIAAEGLYNIRASDFAINEILIDKKDFLKKISKIINTIQNDAIKLYGTKFTKLKFYSEIAQNKNFISKYNNELIQYNIYIDYYPRILDSNNKWIIDDVYFPIFIMEKKLDNI